jgi:hypothetical protein
MSWNHTTDLDWEILASGGIPVSDPLALARVRAASQPRTRSARDLELDKFLDELLDFRLPSTPARVELPISVAPLTAPTTAELAHDELTPEAATTGPETVYEFPCDDWELLTDTDSQSLIDELQGYLKAPGNPLTHYALHRERICNIHLALNRLGTFAPRFRLQPRISKSLAAGSIEGTVSRDRQIIDLHWLHERGHRRTIDNRDVFRELMSRESLDFEVAERFVCWRLRRETKFEALGISDVQAAELSFFQPEHMREAWRAIETKRHRWLTKLHNDAPGNMRKHFESWLDVRAAIELIGPRTPPHHTARLVALMTASKPIDDRGMDSKRTSVLRYLPV